MPGNNQIAEILPNRMYRAVELEEMLGKRCIQTLRQAGLRAISGWYLGQIVIDSFKCAWQMKKCQRVPAGKEDENEKTEHAGKMEKSGLNSRVQPLPKHRRFKPLQDQIEEIGKIPSEDI